MIFVDSSVLIDYFNGKKNWQVEKLDEILGKEIVVIGDYVLVEVLQGFRNDNDYNIAKGVLKSFPCLNICGEEIAIKSANNYRVLRKKGVTVRKTIDVVIATFCIENELQLLHNDKDFFALEKHLGLQSLVLKSS
ncbi:MAG: PIN domain nuclease [Ignavibacterium sp.]|jgi:predicted nucleic acid-binding protein|nr:PIN domain nuclease [Ignavibacterium sp.]